MVSAKAEDDRQDRRGGAVEEIGRQAVLVAPELCVAVEAELVREVGRRYRRLLDGRLQRRQHRQTSGAIMTRKGRCRRRRPDIWCGRPSRGDEAAELAPSGRLSVYSRAHRRACSRLRPWLRRVSIICTTVKARTITARMSDSAAP